VTVDDVTFLERSRSLPPLRLGPIISQMAGDTNSVTIAHLYEMVPGVSNCHVTGDVTCRREVTVVA